MERDQFALMSAVLSGTPPEYQDRIQSDLANTGALYKTYLTEMLSQAKLVDWRQRD